MKSLAVIAIALLCPALLQAQEKIRYTDDFRFARGIYTSLEDFQNNDPVKPSEIITDIDPGSPKFFQHLLALDQFRFPRNNEIVYLKPGEIFGYSDGRQVFYGTRYRMEVVGKICLLREVDVVDSYSSFINPGDKYQAAREQGSGKLYILDFETGGFFPCKASKLKPVFRRDAQLYQEYQNAKGRKKDKALDFIKEYNFRHPVYFPG